MLTHTSDDGCFKASVKFDRYDGNRVRWTYEITVEDETIAKGDDLTTPSWDIQGALESLASFLGAHAEAKGYPGSENRDLFPVAMWDYSEYVEMFGLELMTDSEGE